MRLKAVSGMMLTLLLIGMLTLTFNIQPAKADWTWTETIYIRADGSVDPDTAPISSVDNITYTLTDNIVGDVPPYTSAIVVGRDNIVVDGAGYTLQGTGVWDSKGIDLTRRSNVTIKNTEIKSFWIGILLGMWSSNNTISGNNITNNYWGIMTDRSSYNTISRNTVTNNEEEGIWLSDSSNNTISGNNITNNGQGILLNDASCYNSISGNSITKNNGDGIMVSGSSNNNISGNNITNNWWRGISIHSSNNTIYKNNITNSVMNSGNCINLFGSSNIISGNNMTARNGNGIQLWYSSNENIIYGNEMTNCGNGIILFDGPSYNNISGNNMRGNRWSGIWLERSLGNIICGNSITNNSYGIYFRDSSHYNSIFDNNITANLEIGVDLGASSDNNTISENDITDNDIGIKATGGAGDSSSNNTISGNNVTNNGYGIHLYESSNYNNISGNNITNNGYGIYLRESSNNRIFGNKITFNEYGIYLHSSHNNTISGNTVTANNGYGIWVYWSSNNAISGNNITANSENGIWFHYHSNYNSVSGNNITNNGYGIRVGYSQNNTISGNNINENNGYGVLLDNTLNNLISGNNITNNGSGIWLDYHSRYNIISGNDLTNNWYGIRLEDYSSNNIIYHNNFVDNGEQVYSDGEPNVWDDGYPSGGNYWSDYTGFDVKSGPNQDQPSSDGIGDTAYVIDGNNRDNYPLMNPWTPTETSIKVQDKDYPVTIVSNTTIDQIGATANTLNFTSSGPTGEKGYILVIFPMVNTTEIKVFIDGVKLTPPPFPVINTNGTHYFIYFEFTLSIHNIAIQFAPLEYTLTIYSSPTGVMFTVDSVSRTTPWSGTYIEGASVSLIMPEFHDGYVWSHWLEDGDTNRIKTVSMNTNITLTGVFTPVPPPPPVGGKAIPINKVIIEPELPFPWIWLSTIILSLVLTVVYVKKRKRDAAINSQTNNQRVSLMLAKLVRPCARISFRHLFQYKTVCD